MEGLPARRAVDRVLPGREGQRAHGKRRPRRARHRRSATSPIPGRRRCCSTSTSRICPTTRWGRRKSPAWASVTMPSRSFRRKNPRGETVYWIGPRRRLARQRSGHRFPCGRQRQGVDQSAAHRSDRNPRPGARPGNGSADKARRQRRTGFGAGPPADGGDAARAGRALGIGAAGDVDRAAPYLRRARRWRAAPTRTSRCRSATARRSPSRPPSPG